MHYVTPKAANTEAGRALNGRTIAPIRKLVEEAIAELYAGNLDTERAVWRLVDAAGLLADVFPEAIGVAQPTGRGYQIVVDPTLTA